jgi:hypothetical protein
MSFVCGTLASILDGISVGFSTRRDEPSAKIEYNYLAFSTSNHQFTGTGAGQFVLNTGIQQQLHLVKAGINYRWGWAPVGIRY